MLWVSLSPMSQTSDFRHDKYIGPAHITLYLTFVILSSHHLHVQYKYHLPAATVCFSAISAHY